MEELITGIQQVGIGVTDASQAKLLYRDLFGMDVLIFDDKAEASLMTAYTGKQIHNRRAILSMNMSGGGGFEIWQFTSRKASMAAASSHIGDIGIFATKIKASNIEIAHRHFSTQQGLSITPVYDSPDDRKHFWLTDTYGNHFNIVEGDEWFKTGKKICGGVTGAVIGVSDMDKALHFYKEVMGINETVYSGTAPMVDMPCESVKGQVFRRVLLKKKMGKKGAFSNLLGSIQIELIEAKERIPKKIYQDRFWGDCGFIHLCFDVLNMKKLKELCTNTGYPFTVDSANSFAMGESAGRFCYVEDPDGTLIELVETHKVPILKKIGWYIDLTKRKQDRPLPSWMIGMLAFSKVR